MTIILFSDSDLANHLRVLQEQPDTITGHYIMDDSGYGGPYTFPNNKDKLEIHWPPNVVPEAPEGQLQDGQEFYYDNGWKIRDNTRFNGDNTSVPNPLFETSKVRMNEEEKLRFLPMPTGIPFRDKNGNFPITVLNEDETAWVWEWPEVTE